MCERHKALCNCRAMMGMHNFGACFGADHQTAWQGHTERICGHCSNGGYLTAFEAAGVPTSNGTITLSCPNNGLATGFELTPYTYGFQSLKVWLLTELC